MASRYRNFHSEGQDDKNACWAACLVWWLRATNKARYEQWELMSSDQYSGLWDVSGSEGTVSEQGILTIVQDSRWGMTHQKLSSGSQLDTATIKAHLNFGPVYIGYKDLVVNGNHINIIYDCFGNDQYPQVSVMEPGYHKKSNGKFKGKHLTRGLSYYKSSGVVILASPSTPISLDR
jgi:hypothetical protein